MKTISSAPAPFAGFVIKDICALTGLPYVTVWRHLHGQRNMQAEYALRYHRALGIPLHELRPDLWPAPADNDEKDTQEAADGAAC